MLKAILFSMFVFVFMVLQPTDVNSSQNTDIKNVVVGRLTSCMNIPVARPEHNVVLVQTTQALQSIFATPNVTCALDAVYALESPEKDTIFSNTPSGGIRQSVGAFNSMEMCMEKAIAEISELKEIGYFEIPNIQLLVSCIPTQLEYDENLTQFMHEERERTGQFPNLNSRRS